MEGVPEIAESVFDLPVRRGAPGDHLTGRAERTNTKAAGGAPARASSLADVVKSPVYATAVGLALYGARRQAPGLSPSEPYVGGVLGRWGRRLAGWFGEIF
jgi:cell division protein FtsA